MAEAGDFVLLGDADFLAVQGITLGNFNLGLYNIKTGNFFGNGMFNLNTRVNLDKIELAVLPSGVTRNSTVPALR